MTIDKKVCSEKKIKYDNNTGDKRVLSLERSLVRQVLVLNDEDEDNNEQAMKRSLKSWVNSKKPTYNFPCHTCIRLSN